MYSVIGLLKKADTTTTEEFRNWWQEKHVPHVLAMPGLREYVIYPIDTEMDGRSGGGYLDAAPAYDGVAIITFDSKEAFEESFRSPEGQADNESFQAVAPGSTVLLGEAHFQLRGEIPASGGTPGPMSQSHPPQPQC